ncbi:uncharacterized protein LOC144487030, partial [Mustelus asterias]
MRNNKNNKTAPSADDSELTYSELNFAAASQNSTIRTRAEPETTYAQIAVRSQSAQPNPGSEVTPGKDDSELTYSELNFAAAYQNSTIRTRAEPETTYAQIAVRSQSAQPNPGSEVAPGKDQRQQETAGGTNSKKSRCLGLVALLIIILLFVIIIGLTVYVLQLSQDFSEAKKEQRTLRERGDWLNTSLANSVRNLTEMSGRFQNISESFSQSRQKAISLCATLRNISESLCPSGWKLHNQICYRFSRVKVNWNTAKRECGSLNSHLLIINTDQEQ